MKQCKKSKEEQTCQTCEFNFGQVCANKYYGEAIGMAYEKAKEKDFECWTCSLDHFINMKCNGKC